MNTQNKYYKPYSHLILSGGGYSALVYIGVYRCLLQYKILKDIKHIYGTSAGSIFGFLIGLGLEYNILEDIFIGEKSLFTKDDYIKFDTSDLFMFDVNKGIFSINRLRLFIEEILEDNYNIKDITFQEYLKKTGKDLHITSTCVNTSSIVDFCEKSHPNMSVITAIMCSSAVPFIFQPVEYEDYLYIDGGCINNIPITTIKKEPMNKLLVINLTKNTNSTTKELKSNLLQYIWNVLSSSLHSPVNLVKNNKDENTDIIDMLDNKMPCILFDVKKEFIYTTFPKEVIEESIIYGYLKIYNHLKNITTIFEEK